MLNFACLDLISFEKLDNALSYKTNKKNRLQCFIIPNCIYFKQNILFLKRKLILKFCESFIISVSISIGIKINWKTYDRKKQNNKI